MRSVIAALIMLGTSAAAPAWAQWSPPGPYTFVQGQTYELAFVQPALPNFLALEVLIRYPSAVFEPLALLPGSLASMVSVSDGPPVNVGGGSDEILLSIIPSLSLPFGQYGVDLPAGSLFGVRFQVKEEAPLGDSNPTAQFTFSFGDPSDLLAQIDVSGDAAIPTSIVAIPEPESWAMMLAGLTVIGIGALRARRARVSV